MTDNDSAFQDLLHACSKFPRALQPVAIHGFLTGLVIGPEDTEDDPIFSTVYGYTAIDQIENQDEMGEYLWDAADEIVEDLINASFNLPLRTDPDSPEDLALWMAGFNKAVALNEAGWRQLNEENIEAGKKYAYIQSLCNPELAEIIFGIPTERYDAYLNECLPLLPEALIALYHSYWMNSPEAQSAFKLEDLPSFSQDELAQQTDDELFESILTYDDMLPRSLVDEAIQRGQPMAIRLRRHLEDPSNWSEEVPAGHWWGLIHAVFILGFMTGEDATQGLLHAIKRMDNSDNIDLWDWLAGYWPVLFRNKRSTAAEGLQNIAEDQRLDWQPRVTAWECLLEAAQAAGPDALDEMLQRITGSVADGTEDWDYRIITSHFLLDFPRNPHRLILEKMVFEQKQHDDINHYRITDVDDAYHLRKDRPEWERFTDPLKFYDPENILSRQVRWSEEEDLLLDDPFLEDSDEPPYPYDLPPPSTYVRETPKVGRNDPCPCGSGKKYKKCCLKKLH